MDGFSRREVLGVMGVAAVSCCGLAGCKSMEEKSEEKPAQVTSGTVTLGPASDFPAGSVHLQFQAQYGIIVVNDSGTPAAIRPKCTHKGCVVAWKDDERQFVCPCHGSEFSILGLPTHGPAERPLPAIACMKAADGTVSVDLTKLYAIWTPPGPSNS